VRFTPPFDEWSERGDPPHSGRGARRATPPVPITVVLAIGRARWGSVARARLEAERSIRIVAEVGDGPGAVAVVRANRPAVIVVDRDLSPGGALGVLPALYQVSPAARALAVTAKWDDAFALNVVRVGGKGVMVEEMVGMHLVKAVRCLAAGETWLTRAQEAQVLAALWQLVPPGVTSSAVRLES